ncbi:hypothetical protein ACI2K4_00530 [Micromonospora sp. NPDC050397]|uniref:hypothetical protein n=1 Tax=Micromonospora sp. NPDC050397 TaxID=3364279 RepID=UPI00384B6E96
MSVGTRAPVSLAASLRAASLRAAAVLAVLLMGWAVAGPPAAAGSGWMSDGGSNGSTEVALEPAALIEPAPSSPPAEGEGPILEWKIRFSLDAPYAIRICVDSPVTIARGKGGICRGNVLTGQDPTLTIPYRPGDRLTGFFGVSAGPDIKDVDLTGATQCNLGGHLHGPKLVCDSFHSNVAPSPPPLPEISPYNPAGALRVDGNGKSAQLNLLNVLAWCVSAAGVAGLLLVGMQMALQVRRGVPGAMAELRQEATIVAIACILAMTVGPIIAFLNIPLW